MTKMRKIIQRTRKINAIKLQLNVLDIAQKQKEDLDFK